MIYWIPNPLDSLSALSLGQPVTRLFAILSTWLLSHSATCYLCNSATCSTWFTCFTWFTPEKTEIFNFVFFRGSFNPRFPKKQIYQRQIVFFRGSTNFYKNHRFFKIRDAHLSIVTLSLVTLRLSLQVTRHTLSLD